MRGRFRETHFINSLFEIERDSVTNDSEVLVVNGERRLRHRSTGQESERDGDDCELKFHSCELDTRPPENRSEISYFVPVANTVWKCGLCFSRETTRTSTFLKPASSSNSCNCTSLKPSQ